MPTVPVPQAFALALQHHQAGRLAEAEMLYRQILAVQPNHAEARHYLGVIADHAGRHDLAVEWIRQAIALAPDNFASHYNIGEAYRASNRLEEAAAAYRRAIELKPDYAEAYNSLGFALAEQHQFDEAMAVFRRAVQLKPDYALAHNNLANTLKRGGQLDEAVAAYRRALALQPDYTEAHANLGTALAARGDLEEAIAMYRQAIELKPDHRQAYNNLGAALVECGRADQALEAFRRALALRPNYPEALNNLGIALADLGRIDQAMAAYRRAFELKPGYAEAHNNLGNALGEHVRFDEAIAAFRRAVELKPDYAEAHNNLGYALKSDGQLEEAIAAYRRALALKPDHAKVHSNLIYALHFHPARDEATIADEQRNWNRQFSEPLKRFIRPHTNDRSPDRRLKIGYVSPDFCSHPVSFFLAPLLESHDHGSYEIYCYANVRRPDAVTERLRKSADVWRDVRAFSDARLAECVRDDGIDILVDLAMHTTGNRLPAFARKPAPVQVSWLAYPRSTGVEAIDYRLTDAHMDSVDQADAGLGGQAVRLPDAWCCYAPLEEFPPVGPLPAAQKGIVTFGSLNQFSKVNEGQLRCWAALLKAVPESRLLLICPEGHAQARTHFFFADQGIARERVELVAPCRWPDYLQLFGRIDLALDTNPCNGMTTTCHTMWMGVPVVTRAGPSAVSRAGSSLLRTIGLPEWVAASEEEYIRIAAAWANDPPRLAELRETLRSRMQASPLMDAPRFARHVEATYRMLWQKWCGDLGAQARE